MADNRKSKGKKGASRSRGKSSETQSARLRIGLLTGPLTTQHTNRIWMGVADAAREAGVDLIYFPGGMLDVPADAQSRVLFDLLDPEMFDGLVLWGAQLGHATGPEAVRALCEQYGPLPMVSIGLPLEGIPSVTPDNYQGMRDVIAHLVEDHGRRRIACLRGPENPEMQARYRAYVDVLAEHDIPLDPHLVASQVDLQADDLGQRLWQQLRRPVHPYELPIRLLLDERGLKAGVDFDAIVGLEDNMALSALELLRTQGVRVPDEVAVVSFDDVEDSQYAIPPLTTVRQSFYEQGRQATYMLLAQLRGEEMQEQVSLPMKVIVRRSCGCIDPAVMEAEVGPVAAAKEAFGKAFAAQRSQILLDMIQAVGAQTSGVVPGWGEQLLEDFAAEMGKSSGVFLSTLEDVIRQTEVVGGDVNAWCGAISTLRRWALPYLAKGKTLSRAEDLWQQARVVIGKEAQRQQARRRLQVEQQGVALRNVSQALTTAFSQEEMVTVLADGLPQLGIPSAYLSLYETPQLPTAWSRLILAYDRTDGGQSARLEVSGQNFPSRQLVPSGLLKGKAEQYNILVEPLYFGQDQLGFVLLEAGPLDWGIYETLRGQLSSAVRVTQLVQQLEQRALQLQTAAEVSRAASSILDLDELIQQVVDLVGDRFELYYAGLFLVDETGEWTRDQTGRIEPGRWAVLQAGTGEAGQKMLAEGHKLEIGGESMIGQCVITKQGRVALDVGEEPVRFDNPHLPKTHSELALPLISRGEVIGALTIQSTQEAAFSQEDIFMLQTMADQLANAIVNARLYEALEQEQNLMHIFMDNVPDSIYFKDTESRFLRISRAQADMFSLSDPAEAVGKTDFDFFTEEHARPAFEDEQAIIQTGQPIIGKEEEETWADRPSAWVSTTKMPMYDREGSIIGTFGISRNITALKQAEQALAYESNLLRAMMDGSPDFIFFKDRESRFIRVNVAHAKQLLGLDGPQEAVGKTGFDFFSQEEAQRIYDVEQTIMESGEPIIGQESRIVDSSGTVRWVSESKVPMLDDAGQVIGLIGISRDVSDRKLIERDLQMANEELELYTAAVERRAMQLHTAAEVAREATAILDVGQILEQTVNLISERFGFYHAGVFLIDEQNEYAVLRAASSVGGQRMLMHGHKLQIGEVGIVGYVTAKGEPRIAFDVGEDAAFFDNPDLPETRSEMALPLMVHGRIIGALDVQSAEPSAFTEEDVTTLQTMADQLAISIENARLVERTESQLRELSLLYGQYSSSVWSDVEALDQAMGYVYDRVDVLPITDSSVPVSETAIQQGETVALTDPETVGAVLAVPLRMRGQVIGTLGIQQTGADQEWTPEQVALVETVSEQVAQALESARLFAETQRTAQSMEALYQTSRALSSSMDEESLMRAILETVYRTLNCEHVLVSTVDEAAKTLGIQHGIWQGQFDVFPEWIEMSRYSLDQPDILTDVYHNKQTEVIAGWDNRFNREIYEKFGHERLLRVFMPIQLRDRVLGIVEVGYDRRQKEHVASDELQILAAFMDQAAVALERVRLFEQVQRRADREHQIYEIAAKLRRTPDIATILQTAVDELGRALQTDRALIRLRLKQQAEPDPQEATE